MNDADNHAVGVELVCGSCRYYGWNACHVDPPQFVDGDWCRPRIRPNDTACASFRAPVELLDRLRRQREEAAKPAGTFAILWDDSEIANDAVVESWHDDADC